MVKNLKTGILIICFALLNIQYSASQNKSLIVGKLLNLDSLKTSLLEKKLDLIFKQHAVFRLNGIEKLSLPPHKAEKFFQMELVLGSSYDWTLDLEQYDLKQAQYIRRVATANEVITSVGESILTYRGFVNGDPKSKVRISAVKGKLTGVVLQGGEELFFEPAQKYMASSDSNLYVVYKGTDVIAAEEATCGMGEAKETLEKINGEKIEYATTDKGCIQVEIAIAADYSFVEQQGSVNAAETRIINILNLVNGFYSPAPLEIEYKLVETFFSSSTATDPWSTSTDAEQLLTSFRNWGNNKGFSKTFDVASFWTKRNISGNGNSGVVGVATIGAVCTTNKYNVLEHFSTNIKMVAIDQAHELGHNWNCQHSSGNSYIMNPTISTISTTWDQTSINSITNWKNSKSCFTTCGPQLPQADFIADNTNTCTGIIKFTDQSLYNATNYKWDFGDGTTSIEKNPTHNYTKNGSYNVKLTAANTMGTDDEIKSNFINVTILNSPAVTNVEMCGAGVANLKSSSQNLGTLQWFNTSSGGEPIFAGNDYSPTVNKTTTYYVQNSSIGALQKVGPVDNTFGAGANFNSNDLRGLVFDVLTPIKLKSVKVYANDAGNRIIQLMDSVNGKQLASRTINVPAGESRINLDFDIPTGLAYHLKISGSVNLYRNAGNAKYPYTIPNVVSISETDVSAQNPGYYYFFYDWEIQKSGCNTARVPVTVTVNCLTGVVDQINNSSIVAYPNPVKEDLTINCPSGFTQLQLSDLLGKVVYATAENNLTSTNVKINVAYLPRGIYYLNILSNSTTQTIKVSKE